MRGMSDGIKCNTDHCHPPTGHVIVNPITEKENAGKEIDKIIIESKQKKIVSLPECFLI